LVDGEEAVSFGVAGLLGVGFRDSLVGSRAVSRLSPALCGSGAEDEPWDVGRGSFFACTWSAESLARSKS
jgi:hypothetical protein